ncbi:M23 family metallopeptidase [Silvanigrella aquatica]|uniref:M23ase beta-sheet core domain-containing protein n=1 Tax=Silvanigrella aquatica TaxID=1915309 RepID=A0A1L4CXH9_9BACT|nr:M23 family metallopeptidase [Silvanigrella aquatica]APJ02646.1 hypothetical protein AXG55_01340 [Silvanigrella aquatica]
MLFSKDNKKKHNYKYENKSKSSLFDKDTVLFVSKKTGKTHIFRIPSFIPLLIILLTSTLITISATMTVIYINMKRDALELEHIRDESLGLKSEVEALHSKMRNIQSTVNQVTYYSEKIRKVTTRTDDRKGGASRKTSEQNQNQDFNQNGIGPLTKEEFEISNKVTGLKYESLELKSLFDLAQESQLKSSKQLEELKKFLVEAQKAALKLQSIPDIAPVRGRLTSSFGWRISPFGGPGRIHFGVDIAARIGTPIYATANGTVLRVNRSEDYGKFVELIHEKKMVTRYAHTSAIYVKEGAKVKKGDVIGAVGNTGHSTGSHVHYEIEMNGKKQDPENFIVLW